VTETTPGTGRRCWWCGEGSSPENPITREHIIAKWIAGALTGSGTLNHAYREQGANVDARNWQTREPSFKVAGVCRECNNGWMSRLEIAAKRRLPPFMRGRTGLRINYVNAPVLARWAAKTGLMFQACEPAENRVVPPEYFELLRTADVLPPVMRVWIGAVKARGVWSRAFGGTFNLPPTLAVLHRASGARSGRLHGHRLRRRAGPGRPYPRPLGQRMDAAMAVAGAGAVAAAVHMAAGAVPGHARDHGKAGGAAGSHPSEVSHGSGARTDVTAPAGHVGSLLSVVPTETIRLRQGPATSSRATR
jgi:hypothetical protein